VNYIPLHLSTSSTDIFADDTTIKTSAHYSNMQSLTQHLNNDLEALSEWATNNRVFINTGKTKSLLVTGKRISKKLGQDIPHLNVKINNSEISEVSSHQLLGVTLEMLLLCHILTSCVKNYRDAWGLLKHISPYLK
jgi:hypothetical protein